MTSEPFAAHAIVVEALGERRYVQVQLPYRREGLRSLAWGMRAEAATLAAALAAAARHAQEQARLPLSRRAFAAGAPDPRPSAPWAWEELFDGGVVVSLHRSEPYGVLADASVPHRRARTFEGVEREELPLRTSFRELAARTEALVRAWQGERFPEKPTPRTDDEIANAKQVAPAGLSPLKRVPRTPRAASRPTKRR